MNNRINRIISSTVIITAMSMSSVGSSLGLGSVGAHAASYKLTNIDMSGANLYENSNYTDELDNDKNLKDTYYAKLSSDRSKVSIDIDGVDEDCVSITKSKSSKTYEPGDDILISTGKTTLKITVYEDNTKKKSKKTYKIVIKRYTKEEEEERKNDTQDDIYLQELELDYGDTPIGFRFDKMNYDVKVDSDVKKLAIKAIPEDGAYDVAVNGIKLKEEEGYKKDISVSSTGTTKVEVTLSYDDEEFRTYTINISKKDKDSEKENTENAVNQSSGETTIKTEQDQQDNSSQVSQNNNQSDVNNIISNNNSSQDKNKNGWIKSGEKWSYKDDYGNVLKNTWFYDRNYNKKYYFDVNGFMTIGWKQVGNKWYYLDNSGAMVTGWCKVGTSWYYLDYDGAMKTGWFKDSDGKYYYLYQSGEMAINTTISGYKLGNNGAWITK